MNKVERYRVETFGGELVIPAEAASVSNAGSLDFFLDGTMQVSFNSHYWDSVFLLSDHNQGDNDLGEEVDYGEGLELDEIEELLEFCEA